MKIRADITPCKKAGMALVVTLAIMVLMLGITLAFFSQVLLERSISDNSAANAQVDLLARSSCEVVVADILQEIAAGSALDSTPTAARSVFQPLTVNTAATMLGTNIVLAGAPSMTLQKVVATNGTPPANLVKQSLAGRPFFQVTNGYTNHPGFGVPLARAATASTTNRPQRGFAISTNRWLKPQLATSTETLQPPDWVYLNRLGETRAAFSSSMATNLPGNTELVIGRFAYNLYDVGGLVDINVVGNALPPTENARRGRLHHVALNEAPAPLTMPDIASFVAWRSGSSASDNSTNGGLADPARTFLSVLPGNQAFVTRQEMLRYAGQTNTIPAQALPYLTTFNRDLNAPIHAPQSTRPKLPASPNPDELNPSLTTIRFAGQTVLSRGLDPDVTVPGGTPVMVRRFPLSKLNLLAEASPDAGTLSYYFGLRRTAANSYEYTATSNDGRIKRLSEVAAEGREPNFFEVLQAVILTGSLGRNAGNTLTLDDPRDSLRNLQVMQIGANVIDQWDGDDFPTTIQFPSGTPGTFLDSHGIENLPYINNIAMIGHRPVFNRDLFQIWAVFDVWNPHQNASSPPAGLEFRIQPRSGRCRATLLYSIVSRPANVARDSLLAELQASNSPSGVFKDITLLNVNRELKFSSTDYSSPTIIGGGLAPTAQDSTTGLLLYDFEQPVLPAVPAKAGRSALLQQDLNALMAYDFPYTAVPSAYSNDPATGNRIYPAAATISGLDPVAWTQTANGLGQKVVFANYGVKAHNLFRMWGDAPGSKIIVDLQVRRTGDPTWKTYQTFDQFLPRLSDPGTASFKGPGDATHTTTQDSEEAMVDYQTNTHHSALVTGSPLWQSRFYGWRQPRSQVSMVKFDPRTVRFGHSGHTGLSGLDLLGTTIRQNAALPTAWTGGNAGIENSGVNWRVLRDGWITGTQITVDTGFEWIGPGTNPALYRIPFGVIANIPEGTINTLSNPSRYRDLDGIIRPGDGYLGALPTVPGRIADRPRILNRPFQSVGEMGHAFRDLPWKTLDFSTRNSGDLGLLDAFSTEETAGDVPLVAGKVNLNTAPAPVLAALLTGAGKTEDSSQVLSPTEASQIAASVTNARQTAPFRDTGDLVARALSPLSATNGSPISGIRKTEREAAIRTLSGIGSTRTWNFLLDLVVQGGRFSTAAQNANQFSVRAERRYWVHLAIDRVTGEVLDRQWEVVNE